MENYHLLDLIGEGSFGKVPFFSLNFIPLPPFSRCHHHTPPSKQVLCFWLTPSTPNPSQHLSHYHHPPIIVISGPHCCIQVYKGRRKNTGQITALKFIGKHGKSEKDIKGLRQEIEILRNLRHENIIQMLDTFETRSDFVVVTEFAQGAPHNPSVPSPGQREDYTSAINKLQVRCN